MEKRSKALGSRFGLGLVPADSSFDRSTANDSALRKPKLYKTLCPPPSFQYLQLINAMLVKVDTNKTLKGHKLLMLTPWERPGAFIDKLAAEFPGLQVVYHQQSPAKVFSPQPDLPAEIWEDVTIVLTFGTFPEPQDAPKLEYVQLMSAGANHVLDRPIFKDTDVAFCTANGIHG